MNPRQIVVICAMLVFAYQASAQTCTPPTASIAEPKTICSGGSAVLEVSLTGTPPWSITWSDGTVQPDIMSSPAQRTVTPSSTTTYAIADLTDASCSAQQAGSVQVKVATADFVLPTTLCNGVMTTVSVPTIQGATYMWYYSADYSGASGPSFNFVPKMSGTGLVELTATTESGCIVKKGITANVVDVRAPDIKIDGGPPSILRSCANESHQASVSYPKDATRYDWEIVGGSVTEGDGTPNVTFKTGPEGPWLLKVTATAAGTSCTATSLYSISLSSRVTISRSLFGGEGGSGELDLSSACSPGSVHANSSWIHVGAEDSQGHLPFVVDPNPAGESRTGSVSAGGQNFEILQKAAIQSHDSIRFNSFAGSPGPHGDRDGSGFESRFQLPYGVAQDSSGNIYVADVANVVIRRISPAGQVSTYAGQAGCRGYLDGMREEATFAQPIGIAVDALDNLYVTDGGLRGNFVIRKISADGIVSTLAGKAGVAGTADGDRNTATFFDPGGIAVDQSGNVYVSEPTPATIRKVSPSGDVSTIGGAPFEPGILDGPSNVARFRTPADIAVDAVGRIYVTEYNDCVIRRLWNGSVTTVAGSVYQCSPEDGVGTAAQFNYPRAISVDDSGSVFIGEEYGLRRMDSAYRVETIAGSGTTDPVGIVNGVAARGDSVLFTDGFALLRKDGGQPPVVVAGMKYAFSPSNVTSPMAIDADGNAYFASTGANGGVIQKAMADGQLMSRETSGFISGGFDLDQDGNLILANRSSAVIQKFTTGAVETLAGQRGSRAYLDGFRSNARFTMGLRDVAVAPDGSIWIADGTTVRMLTADGMVRTIAGIGGKAGWEDGIGSSARFPGVSAIAVDESGNAYVAAGYAIRKVTPQGEVTTIAGNSYFAGARDGVGTDARFSAPQDLAIDKDGTIYVADTSNSVIRRVAPDGTVSTIAGVAHLVGDAEAGGGFARFQFPDSIVVRDGVLYIADDNRILRAALHPVVGDINGDGLQSAADIVYLINYLFAGGPEPHGLGDVNGDGAVTVSDIFYYIGFLFVGGPSPISSP